MRSTRSARRRIPLVRQLLIFQLTLLALILLAVTITSVEQSRVTFDAQQERRMQTVAEYSASAPLLRFRLAEAAHPQAYTPLLEELRTTLNVDQLIVTDVRGLVLSSPADPRLVGSSLQVGDVASDRGWTGVASIGSQDFVVARAPIVSDEGRTEGVVVAAQQRPSLYEAMLSVAPDSLTFLAVAGLLGILGSIWLAARMKRQTLGLEPDEIAMLVEHREAMVHGLLEGILAVDSDGTITLANDSARRLLGLPPDAQGRSIDDVGLDVETADALRAAHGEAVDRLLINRGALLALNQTVISPARGKPEVVTTLRDRTELVALQHELGSSQQTTDTLRAQTHEFANRLHTISMLIQLGDPEIAADYIDAVSKENIQADTSVRERIQDPAVAALVLGKMALARERGASLTLADGSRLSRLSDDLSADVTTLVGNLVDNALDAVANSEERQVEVDLGHAPGPALRIRVRDSGPGISPEMTPLIFRRGFSSKADDSEESRGFGLAIVKLVVTRRGGRIDVHNDGGAVFDITVPVAEPAHV